MAATPASHLVLARKWRPERFEELVGQEHVTRTLTQALRSGRIAHAFLFTGIRGVGKTTAARILARCLNCEKGPTPEPCGTCAACTEIRSGGALDTVEIDGATYRKIDDARAIIENLGYRPARDRFKIYIIDEAHQLTDQAFNALLKTLEEPPPHVKFILATTEPQKMPETILSRLQRYDFRRIPFATLLARLKQLSQLENASADDAALSLLAREAGGSMRDAERMLETAIASLEGKVSEVEVASILGVASRSRVIEMTAAVIDKDAAKALTIVRELHHRGANLESLGRDILEVLRNLAVAKLPGADGPLSPLADLPDQEATELKQLAAKASLRDLMRLFHLLADAQEQLLRSPYPDLILEMALVRMATLAPVLDAEELLRAINGGGGTAGGSKSSVPAASAPTSSVGGGPISSTLPPVSNPVAAPTNAPTAPFEGVGTRRIPIRGEVKAEAPARGPISAMLSGGAGGEVKADALARRPIAPIQSVAPAPADAPSSAPRPVAGGGLSDLRDFIRGKRAALAGFMEQGAALRMEDDTIFVVPSNDIYVRYLSDNRATIAELASELYGRRIKVEMGTADANAPADEPSPAATGSSDVTTDAANGNGAGGGAPVVRNAAEAREALYSDPVVRRIFNEFEARLVEVRQGAAESTTRGQNQTTTDAKK
ncbi:MAG TPA: DNA polymerase III subunit gamma/tau [Candidatus Binataceae bacterium]|nr:DNA polymerase III subunit gamma/tau [Candidatus Binataceae bacterium]